MIDLPDWDDDDAMGHWLKEKLDFEYEIFTTFIRDEPPVIRTRDGRVKHLWEESAAITAAMQLNYDPLVEILRKGSATGYLQKWIADHIKRVGFAARKTDAEKGRRLRAAEDVQSIRRLWKENYQKWKRPRELKSAVQFAAERWGIDERSVSKALKGR